MTVNEKKLEAYIDRMTNGDDVLVLPRNSPRVITTRACVHCGKLYQLETQYELCNPRWRDLCDDCCLRGVKLP